jgi:hypothetical protein
MDMNMNHMGYDYNHSFGFDYPVHDMVDPQHHHHAVNINTGAYAAFQFVDSVGADGGNYYFVPQVYDGMGYQASPEVNTGFGVMAQSGVPNFQSHGGGDELAGVSLTPVVVKNEMSHMHMMNFDAKKFSSDPLYRPKKRVKKASLPVPEKLTNVFDYKDALSGMCLKDFEEFITIAKIARSFSYEENELLSKIDKKIRNRESARKSRARKKQNSLRFAETS